MKKFTHAPIRPPRNLAGEKVYTERWAELMAVESKEYLGTPLENILWNHAHGEVGQREASVAATFICWLGSGLGIHYLAHAKRLMTQSGMGADGYLAAWAVQNQRRVSAGGMKPLEEHLRTELDMGNGTYPSIALSDFEVVEHVTLWLGSEEGQKFIALCEAEIARYKKLETIDFYHSINQADHPAAKRIKSELAAASS